MSAVLRDEVIELLSSPIATNRLIITPLLDPDLQIGPGSVDLRLGTEFLETSRRQRKFVDPLNQTESTKGSDQKTFVPLGHEFILHPGQFVLGATLEFLRLPANLSGQVVSRSSWGRIGLLVATAVAVQPGFKGVLTLELVNTGSVPVVLRPGLRIAQLQLWKSSRPTSSPYGDDSKYQAPLGPESNRLALEKEEGARLERISEGMQGIRPPEA